MDKFKLYDWVSCYGLRGCIVAKQSIYYCLYFPKLYGIIGSMDTAKNPHGTKFRGAKCIWTYKEDVKEVV